MDYFPAFLTLDARNCLLVGAGEVATRKAALLLSAGAKLTVVAPQCTKTLTDWSTAGRLRLLQRAFQPADVVGHWLVVSATDDPQVQAQVKRSADAEGIFCNCVDDPVNSSYINPAIVDRNPLIVAISTGGAAPVLARKIRAELEIMLPASLGKLARIARGLRAEVSRTIGDALARRRFWESFFEGRIARMMRHGESSEGHIAIRDLLQQANLANDRMGEAWLVGAGPGDPELLTLRALQLMQSADVIVHDRLVSKSVLNMARRDAQRISVGKIPGNKTNSQEEINELLVSLVASGKRVCRLKGGDPLIFGRGGEEAAALEEAGLPYQIVPGITAAAGCAAYAGIPLTHREVSQSVVLLTGHGKESLDNFDWPSLARDRQTLAVYMAVGRFKELMNNLIAHGRPADTPVAIIERGTTPEQRVIRGSLGQLTMMAEANGITAPAMLIIGEVARLGMGHDAHKTRSTATIRGQTDDLRQYSANNW